MFCTTSVLEKCLRFTKPSWWSYSCLAGDTFPKLKSCKTLFLTTKAFRNNRIFCYESKFYKELKKKLKKFFLTKLKIMMLFISPKRKNASLEMALKSFILSKLDHQMSKSWKWIAAHELETTSKFDLLKNWVPDCSAQGRISAKSF